ncbi:MAG TPA: peptide deformylase [Cytophagales bacterium]|nr:peptide deformylase [Cytophagales bacterium]
MIFPIVAYGDPVLKKKAVEIERGSIDVKKLADDMFETMYEANGVGLAAPQVNLSIRMFVVDGEPMDEALTGFKKVFINPVILKEQGNDWGFEEGCLSIPTVREEIQRKEEITIKYFDTDWNEHQETYDGLRARIIQHEYDHIEGVLFLDRISPFKKRLLKSKLMNISKGNVSTDYRMRFPSKK